MWWLVVVYLPSHDRLLWPHGLQPTRFLSPEVFQVRILEWVVISSSRGSSRPRDWTHVSCISCIAGGFFTYWAIWIIWQFCVYFFFEEPTYSFPQWLYHFNSSNRKGSYYWSKGSLTFSCCFFFFNTQPSGCKTIKNHHSLSSFITKQCASQTSMLYPWLLLSLSLSSPPHGCCMHEIVTQETRPCCLVFFPIFYYENVQIQQSWRQC